MGTDASSAPEGIPVNAVEGRLSEKRVSNGTLKQPQGLTLSHSNQTAKAKS